LTLRRQDYYTQSGGIRPGSSADMVTDCNGYFHADSLEKGRYFLEINNDAGMALGIPLVLSGDTNLESNTLQKVIKHSGTVTIEGAQKVPVTVAVLGLERYLFADSATGEYVLNDLPAGSYTLRIVPRSYEFASVNLSVPFCAPGDSTLVQTIVLSPFIQENYSVWAHSRHVVVNTTANGANISESLAGFPLLVRLDSTTLNFSEVLADGADLRFSTVSGVKLHYEIESWDISKKEAAVWVLVDTIKALDTTELIMYWGNAKAPNFSNGAAVFDTVHGFAGVWHMKIDGGLVRDATAFANHGTPKLFDGNESVAGCIGLALSADKSGNYVVVADKPELRLRSSLTISVWVHGSGYGKIINKTSSQYGVDYDFYFRGEMYPELVIGVDSSKVFYTGGNTSPDAVAWNFLGVTYDGAKFRFVTNSVANVPAMNWNGPIVPTASPLSFFASPRGDEHLQLPLDEIRIERVVRSQAWLSLCYENQRTGQVVVRFR
jgi:hypothetical protein